MAAGVIRALGAHPGAVVPTRRESGTGILRDRVIVGVVERLHHVPAVPERRPVGRRRDVVPLGERVRAPVARAAREGRHIDLVVRGARHRIPVQDRRRRRHASRRPCDGIGRRVDQAQVLHRRPPAERRLVDVVGDREGVVRCRSRVRVPRPGAGILAGVVGAHPPVVRAGREQLRRCERCADRVSGAAHLGPRRPVRVGVDLHLVVGGAGDRRPRELRVVDLVRGVEVGHRERGRDVPVPGEGPRRRRRAAVALGVDRRHVPVVRPRRKPVHGRVGARRRVGRVRRRRVAADERRQVRVGGDLHLVLLRARHRRPVEQDRRGIRQRVAVTRRLRHGHVRPVVVEGAHARPGAVGPGRADRADTPVVGVVAEHLRQRRTAVGRRHVHEGGREGVRARELELVLGGAGDAAPGEDGQAVDRRAVVRRAQRRGGQGSVPGRGRHGGNDDDSARGDERAEMSNQTRNLRCSLRARGERLSEGALPPPLGLSIGQGRSRGHHPMW
jgi:hypothetical protein